MQDINQEKKRIKIACFSGWKIWNTVSTDIGGEHVKGWTPSMYKNKIAAITIPDYFGSLDALHEAQKYLPDDVWPEYWDHLSDITGAEKEGSWGKFYTDPKALLNATAANHAEAFYRTISNIEEIFKESAENP